VKGENKKVIYTWFRVNFTYLGAITTEIRAFKVHIWGLLLVLWLVRHYLLENAEETAFIRMMKALIAWKCRRKHHMFLFFV
jgi:hypothetical protein